MAERLIALSEPELEQALIDLGRHIAYPPTPALAARVRQEIARRPARAPSFWERWLPGQRRLAYALVALILLAGAVLAFSPEARTAVAERPCRRGRLARGSNRRTVSGRQALPRPIHHPRGGASPPQISGPPSNNPGSTR